MIQLAWSTGSLFKWCNWWTYAGKRSLNAGLVVDYVLLAVSHENNLLCRLNCLSVDCLKVSFGAGHHAIVSRQGNHMMMSESHHDNRIVLWQHKIIVYGATYQLCNHNWVIISWSWKAESPVHFAILSPPRWSVMAKAKPVAPRWPELVIKDI